MNHSVFLWWAQRSVIYFKGAVKMSFLTQWLESLDYDYKILPHCSRHKSSRSSCMECVDNCPEDAIQIKDNVPIIDAQKCTECGDCVASCPVQAVEGFLSKRTIK